MYTARRPSFSSLKIKKNVISTGAIHIVNGGVEKSASLPSFPEPRFQNHQTATKSTQRTTFHPRFSTQKI
jgi:hypothetical protein